jgi:site-specific recombinase XerD
VNETAGTVRRRARARKTLDAVEKGLRKPTRRTFGELLDEFDRVALTSKRRKRRTLIAYRSDIKVHLRPAFGAENLERLSRSPERFEEYASDKLADGLSPKSVRKASSAARSGVQDRAALAVDLRESPRPCRVAAARAAETKTLTPDNVNRLLSAYRQESAEAPEDLVETQHVG